MNYWAESMLLWSWQALVLIAALALTIRIGRSSSAAERHRLWLIGTLVVALLPVAKAIVHVLPIPAPVVEPLAYLSRFPATIATPMGPENPQPETTPKSWRPLANTIFFCVWVLGVFTCTARFCGSHWRSRRLRAAAERIERGLFPVPLGYSSEVCSPILAGVLHPMILLPRDIDDWATSEERRAVIQHELAHFDRRDHVVNLFQSLLGAVFFFHPAVRYALRQLTVERELACDERVLIAGSRPAVYAEAILKVAERGVARREIHQLAFNSTGKLLDRRMNMILNYRSSVSGRSRLVALVKTTAVLVLAIVVLPQRAVTHEAEEPAVSVQVQPVAAPPVASAVAPSPAETGARNVIPQIASVAGAGTMQPIVAQAQSTAGAAQGSLSGTVYDRTGAVIPGVTVALTTIAGAKQTALTNESGIYAFPQIASGEHILAAALPGFMTSKRNVVVRSGVADIQDIALELAAVSTQVEVSARRGAATGPPTPAPTILRIGGVVSAANLIYSPKPVYPLAARAKDIQDYVLLQGVIGTDGRIGSLQVVPSRGSGSVELVQAAMDAVREWRYQPARLNGQPMAVVTTITVNFTLMD